MIFKTRLLSWHYVRTFWLLILFVSIILIPLLSLAVWQPEFFNKSQIAINKHRNILYISHWLIIAILWWYWTDIIALIGRRYQWTLEKICHWQYIRYGIIIWLIAFELLVCENYFSIVLHWLLKI